MNSNNPTEIELPDGTQVTISVDGSRIDYTVEPGKAGQCITSVDYSPDDARAQAETIRQREAASWDTIFPEQAGPVLDVARALMRAANKAENGESDE